MSRVRVQIMNQFERKSHEYKAIKRYWKLIQEDSRKLSDKRFYRPTFRMHLTNKILDKLLSYSEGLKRHYNLYQLLLFHFQNKESEKFFELIENNLKLVHPRFQAVFQTFLKNKEPKKESANVALSRIWLFTNPLELTKILNYITENGGFEPPRQLPDLTI